MDYPYAKKAFRNFVIAFVLLFLEMFLLMVLINGSIGSVISIILLLPIIGSVIISVLGFIQGVKSVRLKESSKWMKYIGLVGNLILSTSIISVFLYGLISYLLI